MIELLVSRIALYRPTPAAFTRLSMVSGWSLVSITSYGAPIRSSADDQVAMPKSSARARSAAPAVPPRGAGARTWPRPGSPCWRRPARPSQSLTTARRWKCAAARSELSCHVPEVSTKGNLEAESRELPRIRPQDFHWCDHAIQCTNRLRDQRQIRDTMVHPLV